MNELISDKLRGLRAEKKLSYEDVASQLSVHRETYRKYENNPQHMDVGTFLEILEIYKIDPIIFFTQIYGKMPNSQTQNN